MRLTELRKVKHGEFFRLANSESAPVWVRGEYDRSEGKYDCYKFDDVNHWRYFLGSRLAYVGFDF